MPAPMGLQARPVWSGVAFAAAMLPWIWPFAAGPSAAFLPWLASAVCAVVLLGVAAVSRQDCTHVVLRAWLAAAVVSSIIGLVQYAGASAYFRPWMNVTPVGEAFGNLRQRNQFATLLDIGLVVLLFGMPLLGSRPLAALRLASEPATLLARMALPIVVLLAFANAVSLSRTGLFQLLVLVPVVVVWRRALAVRVRILLATAIAAYVAGSVLLPMLLGLDPFTAGIGSRFREPELACSGRLVLWKNVLYLIMQKPWWGWGWGEVDYAHFITAYPGERFCAILDNAHNLPLHLAVVWGIPASAAITASLVFALWRARPWSEAAPLRQVAWAVLLMIVLHSLLEYPLWYGPFQMAAGLAIGVLCSPPARPAGAEEGCGDAAAHLRSRSRSPAVVGMAVALALAASAYAAVDYWRISQLYLAPAERASAFRDDPLGKVRDSWLFRDQVRFAEVTLTPVTPDNAARIHAMARALLHYSPESRVVEKLIDSALVLQRTDEAVFFMRRFRAAYPDDYTRWRDTREPVADLPAIDP